jgi:hypothetical protein
MSNVSSDAKISKPVLVQRTPSTVVVSPAGQVNATTDSVLEASVT